jgi:pyruvate dehydrogenase E2 component (dihydrolipoamide acetyltransferase)
MVESTPLLMPKLGLTMTEGVVAQWMARPGQRFAAGEAIAVVETEKTTSEVEAPADGMLAEILVPEGAKVPVGTALARLALDTARLRRGHSADPAAPPVAVQPLTPPLTSSGRVVATPLARRLARERGIDLATLRGSGPHGRIKAADVCARAEAAVRVAAPATPSPQAAPAPGELVDPPPFQRAVAELVTRAKREIPHFYVQSEAEVSFLLEYRRRLNDLGEGQRISVHHFILKAVGQALVEFPAANVSWHEGRLLRHATADVAFAVSTERGVALPILREAGRLSLGEIAARAGALTERARAGRLGADEMRGGTMAVSNVGMHDATLLTPIIHPGHCAILGVGSIRELFRPGADGRPELRREMGLVLACDHRVLDGVAALAFLHRIVQLLQNPVRLGTPSTG